MRIMISGDVCDEEVIAEPFAIDGSSEQFAVHQSVGADYVEKGRWSATHVETGLALGRGNTIEEAIQSARDAWATASPQMRMLSINRGYAIRALRGTVPAPAEGLTQ